MEQNMVCPFCAKAGGGELEMLLVSLIVFKCLYSLLTTPQHMETFHPEEDNSHSFAPATGTPREQYADCPIEGCGESIPLAEIDYHMDLHLEEDRQVAENPNSQAVIQSRRPNTSTVAAASSSHRETAAEGQNANVEQWGKLLSLTAKSKGKDGEKRLGVQKFLLIYLTQNSD